MGILSGNPQNEPMHYGEVYAAWSFVLLTKGTVAGYQTKLNHAGDEDLRKLLEEAIRQCQQEIEKIEDLLKEVGVGLPPAPPERPNARIEDIPAGARFMDPEIAAALSVNIAAGLVSCSQMIGQSIREDIATLFGHFHTQKATLGGKVLRLNKDKGWIIPPPLHHSGTED